MINTGFTFDDRTSDEFGVYLVKTNSGLINVPYASDKTILEANPNNVITPYFFGVKHNPLNFKITITPKEDVSFTTTLLYNLANWLFQDSYKPFVSDDNVGRIYYCLAINKADFITNGLEQGYVDVEFRCRDPFGWTNQIISEYDLSLNDGTNPTSIVVENLSNAGMKYYYPIIEFELLNTQTSITIQNKSHGNRTISFTNLANGETVYVDNLKKQIISDTNLYRYSNWNKVWFRLIKGVNNIDVIGKCNLKFKAQYPIVE